MTSRERLYRPEDALLAGVCAELARRLGWNVWALRALFLAGLLVQTLATGAVYLLAAVVMSIALGRGAGSAAPEGGREGVPDGSLRSEDLDERARRIEALEKRFRDLERDQR